MSDLQGVRIKIHRAKKHFNELADAIEAFKKRDPYLVTSHENPDTGEGICRLIIREDTDPTWAGMVGDIIHNLRSALDIMAVDLAVKNGRTSKSALNGTYFPIAASKDLFDASLAEKLRYVSPPARRVIERLKPYKGGTDAFWRLHKLDLLDKHVLLVPVGAANVEIQWTIYMPLIGPDAEATEPLKFVPAPAFALKPRKVGFPLKNGQILMRYNTIGTDGSRDPAKHQYNFVFQVAFGEGQIVDGQPLIPTLKQFIDFVERVVEIVAKRFFT
jgi:hypothetical protein